LDIEKIKEVENFETNDEKQKSNRCVALGSNVIQYHANSRICGRKQ
jgi:hypothetical protein